ncbi:MAG: glycosyl hydrolase [Cytophagaceae bacterium]|jgi:glucosylceramidase|nr:glycosyl hydrolase [Cytophagaceae bacterium]
MIKITFSAILFFGLSITLAFSQQKTPALKERKIITYTTAKDTDLRLRATDTLRFKDFGQPQETEVCVFLDPTHTFQTLIGIGGALTDAAAETFAKLPKNKQQEFIKAYYDPKEGIGYTLGRTNMNSCDFSSGSYDYVAENDKELNSFNIAHDRTYKLPLIKQALAATGGKLTLYVSPWSPPAWMKSNKDMLHGGKLLPEYRQSWANYYVKYINALEKEGIPVWGLTVQNEPMAKQIWESCIFTAEEERDFIRDYVGPTLEKAGLSNKKLIAWDHNRDLVYQRASTYLNDAAAAKYIYGIGYHWYETWTGSDMQFENLKRVAETFPDKKLIFTEGCVESFKLDKINEWRLGERYGYSMLNDFNCGTIAWTDWNILLDDKGGPNHVGNFCFAPVHADTQAGKLYYTNSYYYIGHFSKFIPAGSKRIATSSNRDVLQTTAFVTPEGKISVVVLNTTDQKMPYRLWLDGQAAEVVSLPHSIMTLVF